jgi:hypothetical protein
MLNIIEAVLAAIGLLAVLVVICYATAFRFVDWYNRIYLPRQKPETIVGCDSIITTAYQYNPDRKVAVKVVIRSVSAQPPETTWPTIETYGKDGR